MKNRPPTRFNGGWRRSTTPLSRQRVSRSRRRTVPVIFRLVANLTGMNGKELFDLTKHALDELTDENESNRLYAQLAQQKQLSGVSDALLADEILSPVAFRLQYPSDDKSERSPGLNSSFFGSLRTNTLRDADGRCSVASDSFRRQWML